MDLSTGNICPCSNDGEVNLNSLSFAAIEESLENSSTDDEENGDGGTVPDALENCNEIPLGHDRTARNRSLDVQAIGEEATIGFDDLCLKREILDGLRNCRFHKPSPIQVKAIPVGNFGVDLIMQSKSGTGKTCVFSVVVLQHLDLSPDAAESVQAMILAPTREIAVQNADVLKSIGIFMSGLKIKAFIGGTSVPQSICRSKSCNVAVGTPGRILHMIKDGYMDVSQVQIVVIDEADRLMEPAFINDVITIFEFLPSEKQVIAASATYPAGMKDFVKRFMRNPVECSADSNPVLLAVDQYVADFCKILDQKLTASMDDIFKYKFQVILEILKTLRYNQAIIFSKYVLQAEQVYNQLKELSFDAVLLTGALDQASRLISLRDMKEGKCRILVASDVASRGIDCEGVDLVINFEIPSNDVSTYIHRTGRAGRFGSAGVVITLASFGGDYRQLAYFVQEHQFVVRCLKSMQDIKNLEEGRTEKCRKFKPKLVNEAMEPPENNDWKTMLDMCMRDPVEYPSLDLDSFMGFKVNVDLDISKLGIEL